MKEIVLISSAHIKLGKRGDSRSCPVALAIRKHFRAKHVFVGLCSDAVMDGKPYALPVFVNDFISDYDQNGPDAVWPLAFEIDISFGLWAKTKIARFIYRRKS